MNGDVLLTYRSLYHIDLSKLKAAADAWAAVSADFSKLLGMYDESVERPFGSSGWVGPVLTVQSARMRMTSCKKEYENAAVEAKGIHGILADAYSELKNSKDDLHHLADVTAPSQGLHVSESGVVSARHPVQHEKDSPIAPDVSPEDIKASEQDNKIYELEGSIAKVLRRAWEVDESACWALRKDAGGKGALAFNGKEVTTSLDSADAQHAVELMRHGEKMTDRQMSELQHIMHRNRQDPEFTTEFYRKLGPKSTLETIAKLSREMLDSDERRQGIYKDLKKEMGVSLATATDPDNEPHLSDEWNSQLRRAGSERILDGGESSSYGYRALGEILKEGEYDPRFIVPVAEHVTQLQEKHPGVIPNTGVLEALGHSPEAATDFFNGPMHKYNENGEEVQGQPELGKGANGKPIHNYLDYLTDKGYDWVPESSPEAPDTAFGDWDDYDKALEKELAKGPDALGHALEAAVSGRAYDDEGAGHVKHTEERAGLMHRVVEKFGSHPELIDAKKHASLAPMADSLGHMTADYMLDVQRAMGGESGSDGVFPSTGADAHLSELNNGKLIDFIGAVGKDPDAYGAISQAQQAATSEAVKHVIAEGGEETVKRTGDVVQPGAVVDGILAESRATATYDDKIADDKEFNDGLKTGDKWAGRIIGMATSKIPVGGDALQWAIEDCRGAAIDNFTHDSKDAAKETADSYVEENRENSAQAARRATLNAARQAGVPKDEAERMALAAYNQANLAYGDGRNREHGIGRG
ncbi:hypothetical protein [Streptomyces sp. NPDC002067]